MKSRYKIRHAVCLISIAAISLYASQAYAQTTSLSALSAIEQFESGDQNIPNINYSSATTASGYYQINVSTWNSVIAPGTGLPTVTVDNPVDTLTAEQQQQGAAYLYSTEGFQPWVCCNSQLADYIASQGGPSAFALDGTQQPGITVTASGITVNGNPAANASIAAAAAGAGITSASVSSGSFHPFTYLWTQYSSAIAGPLADELGAVQAMIQAPLVAILTLSVMMMAIGAYAGQFLMADFLNRMIRISAVVALTSVGSTYYNYYVVQFFGGLPTWFSNNILGATSQNPAAGFDIVMHDFSAMTSGVWFNLPWGVSTLFFDGPIIAICFLVVFVAAGLMFTVWLIAQALLQLLIVIGPLLILAILFDHTFGWFARWVSAMMLMIFVTLTADIISSIVLKVITGAINTLPGSADATQSTQNVFNIVGIALVVFVLSTAVSILPAVLQHIAAASGAPAMNRARQLLGSATSAASRGAGRAIGSAVKAMA